MLILELIYAHFTDIMGALDPLKQFICFFSKAQYILNHEKTACSKSYDYLKFGCLRLLCNNETKICLVFSKSKPHYAY